MQSKLRQAAILIASLDSATADALLDQLSDEQANMLRRMIVALDEVEDGEQQAVIGQFLGFDSTNDKRPEPPVRSFAPPRDGPPFRFLHEARSEQLLPFLEGEHPQTVAVVISHLPPEKAAQLLFVLPPALQADVMRRLVDLEETDAAILREVELGLEQRIARHVQTQHRRAAGLSALMNILAAADSRLQGQLQANLARHAPQLARLLPTSSSFQCFDELLSLDDAALEQLFDEADRQTVVLALAGARELLVERLLTRLPLHEADALRQAWQQMGPTPLSDMEQAQDQLLQLAHDLGLAAASSQAALI